MSNEQMSDGATMPMLSNRVCAESGLLVDGEARILTDPCEYFHRAVQVTVGCGRLWCASCKTWVRAGPPGFGVKDNVRIDLRAMSVAPDWSALPFLEEPYVLHNRMRLYACMCTLWAAESVSPIDNDHELASDPSVPWACAGHPAPELPLSLNDLTIIDVVGTDWADLVDKILKGSCPRALERKEALGDEPGLWLVWLYLYLHGLSGSEGAATDNLSSAIADRVEDSDPQVVGRVLYFFVHFTRAKGIEKVVACAEANVERVALGYSIPEISPVFSLWTVLVSRREQGARTSADANAAKQPHDDDLDDLDARVDALINRILFLPLASLPHDDLGPIGTGEFERQRLSRHGWDKDTLDFVLKDYARARREERTDVVGYAIGRGSATFGDPEMRVFLADHIVELDAASKGRWRQVMTLLSDWRHKPAQGHLLVIAGARVIQAGLTTPEEFREWIQSRRSYGWVNDAWVVPLESMLKEECALKR